MPKEHEPPCHITACALHLPATATGCRGWTPPSFDLVAVVQAAQFEDCPFAARVVRPIAEAIARRSGGRIASQDLLGEMFVRVLTRFANGRARAPSELAHLRRFAKTVLLDVLRAETGRRRCTACAHYRKTKGEAGGTCRRQYGPDGQPHPHHQQPLPARAEPHRLQPPCWGFAGKNQHQDFHDDTFVPPGTGPRVRNEGMFADQVERACQRLIVELPREGLVVMQHKVDGRTFDDLARESGCSRDQVKRRYQKGVARFRELLDEERRRDEDRPDDGGHGAPGSVGKARGEAK